MPRRVRPPDFRYVWLTPGSSSAGAAFAAALVGVAGCGLALMTSGQPPLSLVLTLGAGTAWALSFLRSQKPEPARAAFSTRFGALPGRAREVAMAIVPWGVVVDPDAEPRVFRWPAVRGVSVQSTHTLRGGTPSVVASVVTVQTDHDLLAGRTPGAVELERLLVDLEGYAEEAQRPVAGDLDGLEPVGDGTIEPVVAALFRRAGEFCTTAAGATRLALPAGGYRAVAMHAAGPETIALLRCILAADLETPADPRPLAAAIAGLLGARELVPDLLELVSSPHPIVAGVAKAAALRLGAPPNRAGAVDEVAAFLCDEDVALLERWSTLPARERWAPLAEAAARA